MKPKKGVMPPALRAYWAAKGRGKKRTVKKSTVAKVSRTRRKRAANPRGFMELAIQTPNGRLKYVGGKFSAKGTPVLFKTTEAIKIAARLMLKNYPQLRAYKFLAVPSRD